MRNMLPDPSFPNSVQAATPGTEQQTLGAYYPVATYYASAQDFENAVGCHAPAVPADSQDLPIGGSGSGGGVFDPLLLVAGAALAGLRRVKNRTQAA